MDIAVDRMTAEQLSALSAYDQGVALNEVIAATAACGKLRRAVRDRIADAKIAVLRAPSPESRDVAKTNLILAETELANLRDRAQELRTQSSILQSLLRAAMVV